MSVSYTHLDVYKRQVYRIEEEAIAGNGKFTKFGTVSKSTTDSISNAVTYFKANAQQDVYKRQ